MAEKYTYREASNGKLTDPFEEIEAHNENPFLVALTSSAFEKRVKKGLKRVEDKSAESGCVVIHKKEEDIVHIAPVVYGTAHRKDMDTPLIINREDAATVRPDLGIPIELLVDMEDKKATGIIKMHWHPYNGPFSESDFRHFDSPESSHFAANFINVLCIPTKNERRGKNQRITKVTMLLVQATKDRGTQYQILGSVKESISYQVNVLRNDGFKVWPVELDVTNGVIDFAPLHAALQADPPEWPQ